MNERIAWHGSILPTTARIQSNWIHLGEWTGTGQEKLNCRHSSTTASPPTLASIAVLDPWTICGFFSRGGNMLPRSPFKEGLAVECDRKTASDISSFKVHLSCKGCSNPRAFPSRDSLHLITGCEKLPGSAEHPEWHHSLQSSLSLCWAARRLTSSVPFCFLPPVTVIDP